MSAQVTAPGESLVDQRTDADEETTDLGKDEIYHLLQNERRRNVLRYLRGREGPVQMRDIAEQVAAWEHDTTVQALMSDQRQRVYIALYQAHLPKLDEEGIIDYNQSRGIVEKKPHANRLIEYLERPEDSDSDEEKQEPSTERSWGTYYLAVSALSAVAIGASGLGLPGFEAVSHLFVALAIMSVYTALTFWQVLDEFEMAEDN
ncbi:DUF7344 domain-containing protein [Haloferax larsenii]|uniref:DUF7344 domain-containing protein n=1 Tax=Haloferax larsenii TaxID=302484 RepID=A0A1H7V3B7_HALLR|nr:hypothetical protein [Haloferax larsenii]ELZ79719.1 hypothetical protein C455_09042 [Haloferax larsenii JCM 13917]UVE52094.1 hypothetical protein KU306_15870 [Haloferax larsenii]SEM03614.1 hypothetical protein SAMN04488691_11628 [Haloferax larsenii]